MKVASTFLVSWCGLEISRRKILTLYSNNRLSQEHDDLGAKNTLLPRREALVLGGLGAGVYAKIVGDALNRLQRGDVYPPEHEQKVVLTLQKAILESARAARNNSPRPFRVLEIGIGKECRSIIRGLYDVALADLQQYIPSTFTGVDIVGFDLERPKSTDILSINQKLSTMPFPVNFRFVEGDITEKIPWSDGSFDVVTSLLVLCSVTDQLQALSNVKSLLRTDGGTFGYVEHVAVDLEDPLEKGRFLLDWEQQFFDPLQQIVANNCHLHRFTEYAINNTFYVHQDDCNSRKSTLLLNQRFFVDDMWPVSCQCCGVVQVEE